MDKYLVTGSSGFIGSHVNEYLANRGEQILPVKHDILQDLDALRAIFDYSQPDYIVHLAAYGNHFNQKDEIETLKANVGATFNLMEASRHIPYKRFYNVSSSSVLLSTQTLYSETKKIGESFAEYFRYVHKKPIGTIRPYSVYGPGEASHRFIPTVIHSLLNDETMDLDEDAVHDWIYVDDFVREMFTGKWKNIGTGIQSKNVELVNILEGIVGKKLKYRKVTNLRAYNLGRWVSSTDIDYLSLYDGLLKTWDFYEKQGFKG